MRHESARGLWPCSGAIEQMSSDDGALPPVPPQPPDDNELLSRIRRITNERGSYGYRRVTALVNREQTPHRSGASDASPWFRAS
jgi:hypothetical protein